jgi:hypothetical protein
MASALTRSQQSDVHGKNASCVGCLAAASTSIHLIARRPPTRWRAEAEENPQGEGVDRDREGAGREQPARIDWRTAVARDLAAPAMAIGSNPLSSQGCCLPHVHRARFRTAAGFEPRHSTGSGWMDQPLAERQTGKNGSFLTPAPVPGVRARATDPARPSAGRRDA